MKECNKANEALMILSKNNILEYYFRRANKLTNKDDVVVKLSPIIIEIKEHFQAQIDKAREEVAREIFAELEDKKQDMFIYMYYNKEIAIAREAVDIRNLEQLKAKYKVVE